MYYENVCFEFSLNIFYFNQYEKGLGKKFYQHYIKPSPCFEYIYKTYIKGSIQGKICL